MAGSGGKQTGILGRLRNTRDRRRQQHVEKARIRGEVKRELERSQEASQRAYRGGAGGPEGLARRPRAAGRVRAPAIAPPVT
jgi:hypothetical protein